MKLFAPRNEGGWSMTDPNSWWPLIGSTMTTSGKHVSEDNALTFSAVFAATRIISEAVAGLPLALKEQVDYRTTRDATDHPLWRLVHDIPNPEQDKMTFFDMQTAFLPNWGNCYAEKQYNMAGQIVALWPIHPSRIPLANITRNATDPYEVYKIVVGQPGEIVYWVKNDDNTLTPIPASDMLHVPGVLSSNGITGQSIIRWAANSIGIAMATEESAGSLFKNGALTNMVIKTMKIVGKETADRLRNQWQTTFGGSQNHYKTLLLEDGMEPVPIQMKPEDTQLILQRQFGVSEIARWWKVPPHMVGDLTRATFSNIEQQYLEFVVHSLGPWVYRWEAAMFRQLLTPEEQKRYRFKFNLNAMLRGDSAARSAFYKSLFDMGVVSPNDIRELEDWNPVEGGDQRFVPANNVVPLEMVGELVQSQIDKNNQPPPAPQVPAKPEPVPADAIDAGFELQREFLRLAMDGLATAENVRMTVEGAMAKRDDDILGTIADAHDSFCAALAEARDEQQLTLSVNVASINDKLEQIPGRLMEFGENILAALPAVVAPLADSAAASAGSSKNAAEAAQTGVESQLAVAAKVTAIVEKVEEIPGVLAEFKQDVLAAIPGVIAPIAAHAAASAESAQDASDSSRESVDLIEKKFELQQEFIRLQFGNISIEDEVRVAISDAMPAAVAPLVDNASAAAESAQNAAISAKESAEMAKSAPEAAKQAISDGFDAISGQIGQIRQQVESIPAPEKGPTADELRAIAIEAIAPLVESVKESKTAIEEIVETQVDHAKALEAMPAAVIEIADGLAKQAAEARDTSESDAIAAEKALLAQKQAEIDEKQRKEREITDKVLILSIKKNVDSLAVWEMKSIIKARENPPELPEWRVKFYQRFIKQFVAELAEFQPGAEACGISLDLKWAAENYSDRSILDLKSLDQHAKDNFFDRIKECTEHFFKRDWTERSRVLAADMVERGRHLYFEQATKEIQNEHRD